MYPLLVVHFHFKDMKPLLQLLLSYSKVHEYYWPVTINAGVAVWSGWAKSKFFIRHVSAFCNHQPPPSSLSHMTWSTRVKDYILIDLISVVMKSFADLVLYSHQNPNWRPSWIPCTSPTEQTGLSPWTFHFILHFSVRQPPPAGGSQVLCQTGSSTWSWKQTSQTHRQSATKTAMFPLLSQFTQLHLQLRVRQAPEVCGQHWPHWTNVWCRWVRLQVGVWPFGDVVEQPGAHRF